MLDDVLKVLLAIIFALLIVALVGTVAAALALEPGDPLYSTYQTFVGDVNVSLSRLDLLLGGIGLAIAALFGLYAVVVLGRR